MRSESSYQQRRKQTAYQACQPVPASNGAWGTIARTGDSNSAGAPAWSHDGNTVAYCSTDHGTKDGRMNTGSSDIFTVPYNDGKVELRARQRAASSSKNEYYPAFSPTTSSSPSTSWTKRHHV